MRKANFSHLNISINKAETSHFSSDLDVGRRPELKSDEFSEVPPLFIEISRCEDLFIEEKVLQHR